MLNKYTLIFVLLSMLLLSIGARSQSSVDFSFGAGVSSGSVYQNSDKNKRNKYLNLTYSKPISKHLFITSGLEYSIHTFTRRFFGYNLLDPFGINGSGTSVDLQGINVGEESTAHFSYKFYVIPISLRYQITSKKLNPFVEIGTSLTYYKRFHAVNSNRNKSPLNVFGMIAIGANYQLTDHYQIFTKLRYNAVLNSIYRASSNGNNTSVIEYNDRLQDCGIAIGVRVLLNVDKTDSQ